MTNAQLSTLITQFRALAAKNSITPESVGYLLQTLLDVHSSELSSLAAEQQSSVEGLDDAIGQAAANAKLRVLTATPDATSITLRIEQADGTALQVQLPAATAALAGVLSAENRQKLLSAFSTATTLSSEFSTLVEEVVIPMDERTAALEAAQSEEWVWLLTDREGRMAFGVRADGSVYFPPLDEVAIRTASIQPEEMAEWAWLLTDNNGRMAFGIRQNGEVYSPGIESMIRRVVGEVLAEVAGAAEPASIEITE